jgi:hypothetical protein
MHTNEFFSIVKMWKKLKLTWNNMHLPAKYRPCIKNPTQTKFGILSYKTFIWIVVANVEFFIQHFLLYEKMRTQTQEVEI